MNLSTIFCPRFCPLRKFPLMLLNQTLNHFLKNGNSPPERLTLSWRRPLSYRKPVRWFASKSMGWFLYDNGLRHESVKVISEVYLEPCQTSMIQIFCENTLVLKAVNYFAKSFFIDVWETLSTPLKSARTSNAVTRTFLHVGFQSSLNSTPIIYS